MKKNTSAILRRRAVAITFGAIAVGIWALGFWFLMQRDVIVKDNLRRDLIKIATLAASLVDAREHARIFDNRQGKNSPEYQHILGIFKGIKASDARIDDIYTLVKTDRKNIWKFGVSVAETKDVNGDGRIDETETAPAIGEEYDVSPYPEMQLAFAGPIADKKPSKDKWGWWISGYAPVLDSEGKAALIVGVDFRALEIEERKGAFFSWGIVIMILGVLAFLATARLSHGFYIINES
jgi:adenylate cyclase